MVTSIVSSEPLKAPQIADRGRIGGVGRGQESGVEAGPHGACGIEAAVGPLRLGVAVALGGDVDSGGGGQPESGGAGEDGRVRLDRVEHLQPRRIREQPSALGAVAGFRRLRDDALQVRARQSRLGAARPHRRRIEEQGGPGEVDVEPDLGAGEAAGAVRRPS